MFQMCKETVFIFKRVKRGAQIKLLSEYFSRWLPACAGMTGQKGVLSRRGTSGTGVWYYNCMYKLGSYYLRKYFFLK